MINGVSGNKYLTYQSIPSGKRLISSSISEKPIKQDKVNISRGVKDDSLLFDKLSENADSCANSLLERVSNILSEHDEAVKTHDSYAKAVKEDEMSKTDPLFATLQQGYNKTMLIKSKEALDEFTDCNSERNQQIKGALLCLSVGLRCINIGSQKASPELSDEIEECYGSLTDNVQSLLSDFTFNKSSFVGFMTSIKDMLSGFRDSLGDIRSKHYYYLSER